MTEHLSFRMILNESKPMANPAPIAGLKKLDKLIFQITNNHDFLNIFWACVLGGIIPVPTCSY